MEWRTYFFFINGGKYHGKYVGKEKIMSRCKLQEDRDAQFKKVVDELLEGAFSGCHAEEQE